MPNRLAISFLYFIDMLARHRVDSTAMIYTAVNVGTGGSYSVSSPLS